MSQRGLIHVYTGDGKGKTTAAVGLATRSLGHGMNVCYCSFHKDPEKYGYTEMQSLRKLGATVHNFAKGHPHLNKSLDGNVIANETVEAITALPKIIEEGHFDLLIMDEILISVRDGYLDEETLLEFIRNKPAELELVMTGRDATQSLVELADYVSQVKKIKHPYDTGIYSREGIEY
jgi:cob(I)alamin adenosyltransferase